MGTDLSHKSTIESRSTAEATQKQTHPTVTKCGLHYISFVLDWIAAWRWFRASHVSISIRPVTAVIGEEVLHLHEIRLDDAGLGVSVLRPSHVSLPRPTRLDQ